MFINPNNLFLLSYLLSPAQPGGFAVGAFNPHYIEMIAPVLRGGERMRLPIVIQIAQVQLEQYQVTLSSFADNLWQSAAEVKSSFHKHVLRSAV